MNGLFQHAPVLPVVIPLLAAFATPLVAKLGKTVRRTWVTTALVGTFAAVCLLLWRVLDSGIQVYVLGGKSSTLVLPSGMAFPVRILFEVDAISAFMAFSGSLVAVAVGLYSIHFLRESSALEKHDVLLLLLVAGMLGMELTGDAFNFFVFLEVASVASFALIAYQRKRPESIEAAFKYMVISTVGALFVLLAVGFLYGRYDALNFAALASWMELTTADKLALVLLVASLAMKSGAVPMHMWVPDAYGEAPASVTALLVSVSQASLYGLFRVVFTLYGLEMNVLVVGWIIIALGLLSMFVGVTMALRQHDIKRLMAYHAVSQSGYMFLGLGVGLAVLGDPVAFGAYGMKAMEGGIFHIINHAMYKGLLFLTAGAIFLRTGTEDLNEMGGLGHKMTFTTVCFIIGAAAISGLPPFNGFASKLLIYESVYLFNPILAIIAMVVSILTLASFVKVFQSAFLGPKPEGPQPIREVPVFMQVGMGVLAVVVVLFGLFPGAVLDYLVHPAAQALVNRAGYIVQVIGGGM